MRLEKTICSAIIVLLMMIVNRTKCDDAKSGINSSKTDGPAFNETDCWRIAAISDPYRAQGWKLLDLRRIWENPGYPKGDPELRHNAFTDLARFKDHWYCCFRSSPNHGQNGKLRVIRSKDGDDWESVALMEPIEKGADLRDPKIAVSPDGNIVLSSYESYKHEPAKSVFLSQGLVGRTVAWLSSDGKDWSKPCYCGATANSWLWSHTAWLDGIGYGVAYYYKDMNGGLYRTKDGREWELMEGNFFPEIVKTPEEIISCRKKARELFAKMDGEKTKQLEALGGYIDGNEASMAFNGDKLAVCYVRGGPRSGGGHLGKSKPPYTKWEWISRLENIGGPRLLCLSDGRFVIGGRDGWGTPTCRNSMDLWEIDIDTGKLSQILRLPSGGDCSYPGIVEHDGILWITYYSSHEDPNPEGCNLWNQRCSVYLAKVRVGARPSADGNK